MRSLHVLLILVFAVALVPNVANAWYLPLHPEPLPVPPPGTPTDACIVIMGGGGVQVDPSCLPGGGTETSPLGATPLAYVELP
ncbi:MAG: hypothetical protein ACYDDF_10130 [Thermoplasmatota archaeon]